MRVSLLRRGRPRHAADESRLVHSRGLKLGNLIIARAEDLRSFEGSMGHEQQDARTYAAWGVDCLKYDLCSYGDVLRKAGCGDVAAALPLQREAYKKMHDALVATGRPIVLSLCQYGMDSVWEWGPEVGVAFGAIAIDTFVQ